MSEDRVAVTSRSFSRHPVLRQELLDRYPDTFFNDAGVSLEGDGLVAFLAGRTKAITALERIDDSILGRLPELRVISKVGVGLDMIDLHAIARRGIRLAWRAGTNSRSVAELVVAFALTLLRRLPEASALVEGGSWSQPTGRLLTGKTVGIVGYGNVGREVATLVRAFECIVLVADEREADEAGVQQVGLDDLLARADVVTLHVPLNESTRNLIDANRLARMKANAILINTARGGLVDEAALASILQDGSLGGAGFDVFSVEPPRDSKLLALPNFLATPHIGGSTEEAILAMGRAAIAGLDDPAAATS